jgi:hypothetical protein
MKILFPILAGICSLPAVACNHADTPRPYIPSLTFRAGNSPVSFQQVSATTETIGRQSTTLITGLYTDTTQRKGSISLRVIGDSARTYRSQEILAAYTDAGGTVWNNTSDPGNTVAVEQLDKKPGGRVNGSFTLTLSRRDGQTLLLNNGYFTAPYQE